MMKKYLITIAIIGLLVLIVLNFTGNNRGHASLIKCLKESGVVIYGSKTCPACAELVNQFGGREALSSIYIECSEEEERCMREIKTGYVPEIQINGELYDGSRTPEDLANLVKCEL